MFGGSPPVKDHPNHQQIQNQVVHLVGLVGQANRDSRQKTNLNIYAHSTPRSGWGCDLPVLRDQGLILLGYLPQTIS